MSDKRIVNIQLTKTKSVAAVEIGKNEYVDADGVTYKNIDSDLISDANDVSEEEKHTFKYLSSLYDGIAGLEEQKHAIDAKIAASKKEIKKQKDALDEEEKLVFKELRDVQGVVSRSEFVQAFYDALPDEVKSAMQRLNFSIGDTPYDMCYNDDNIYIIRNVELYKYNKKIPYCYEEYDGNWFLCDEAEEMEAYKKDVKKAEKTLPVQMLIHSYLWTGEKFSTWYSGVYEIDVSERMTITYAKELAKKFAK